MVISYGNFSTRDYLWRINYSMVDATMPSITLQNIDPAAFKVMLKFLYSNVLPPDDEFGDSLVEMMLHLLVAADRFSLDHLKVVKENLKNVVLTDGFIMLL